MKATTLSVFGIRHHGPGSARSVRRGLEALGPDLVLVEGPPDADAVLPLAADPAMRPPVALLVYRPEAPKRAVFYPFAEFSPEWQAIRFAQERGVPVRFMDLPLTMQFAREERQTSTPGEEDGEAKDGAREPAVAETGRVDPLIALAAAAGYDYAQGFHFSRALAPEKFMTWVVEYNATAMLTAGDSLILESRYPAKAELEADVRGVVEVLQVLRHRE